jgi:hypothetical protein
VIVAATTAADVVGMVGPLAASSEVAPLPLRSAVELLDTLDAPDPEFAKEQPLFGAQGDFAYEHGGPLTRAFLDRLPARFRQVSTVVDSMLVWLQSGQNLASRWFHHEPFPGETLNAFAAANREPGIEFIAAALGAPSHRDFLVGEIEPFADKVKLHCPDPDDVPARDARLREQRDRQRLVEVCVPVGRIHRYEAGTFLRVRRTESPGFHFYVRVSLGTERPIVNGMRNTAGPAVGPWQRRQAP